MIPPVRSLREHFTYEERFAFQHLPPRVRSRLQEEHEVLGALFRHGVLPEDLLRAHSTYEDSVFPVYLPPAMARSLLRDHQAYAAELE